jgi:hypothetical protein
MDNSSTLAIMRRQTANTLRQVERAQADAAALVQWYTNLGGDTWANQVTDAEYTAAGVTKVQLKRAMADLALFPAILNPVALGNVGDAAYKIQLIG